MVKREFVEKVSDDLLTAQEWNELITYINNIVDVINSENLGGLANLATVATTGNYSDLLNKPLLAPVATTGSYNDLVDKPSIAGEQIQSDWQLMNVLAKDYIKNKPSLFSGSYNDLSNKPTIPEALIQSDWNQTNQSLKDYIKNKPLIDEEDLTLYNGYLKFKNRTSDKGKDLVIVRASDGTSVFNKTNTIYVIRYELDLNGGTLTIPDKCTLRFDGGKITNGSITYNKTYIDGFDRSYDNITVLGGSVANKEVYLKYYGTSSSRALTHVLSSGASIGTTLLIDGAIDGSFTSALVLDGDVTCGSNSDANGYITIMGVGKNTQIMLNGYHFKGLFDYAKWYDSDNVGYTESGSGRTHKYAGGLRFVNLMFCGTGASDEYAFDCSSLMRMWFDKCFIKGCKKFLVANNRPETDDYWMQSIRVVNCYARGVLYLVYSVNACYDIYILNSIVEASDNAIYSGKNASVFVIKNSCIENLSGKVAEFDGLASMVKISDNYFENNVQVLDLSGVTDRCDVVFSSNFIGDSNSYVNPIVTMPTASLNSDYGTVLVENNLRGPIGSNIVLSNIVYSSNNNTGEYLIVRNNPNFTIGAPYCLVDKNVPAIKIWRGTQVLYDALSPNYDNNTIYIIS